MPAFVTHLEAAIDGTRLPHDQLQTLHEGRPLWVRYDLEAVARLEQQLTQERQDLQRKLEEQKEQIRQGKK